MHEIYAHSLKDKVKDWCVTIIAIILTALIVGIQVAPFIIALWNHFQPTQ